LYKSTHLLFRDLTDKEEREFEISAIKLARNGYDIATLEIIHPVIRKELVRIIEDSLNNQNLL